MKLSHEDIKVETNLPANDINFKISSNRVIFEILRSKMYQSPCDSVVREITSNALDANVEAGVDTPVEISLPGEYFIVTDSGNGLSPDSMENVFCVYGESTKRDSNDFIGGYGLGAKTPFSLSSTFHVITHSGGIKYNWLAYIDESGCGKIKLISQSESLERGTTIKIPIKPDDRNKFKETVLFYTRFWKIKPKIIGLPYIYDMSPLTVIKEAERWVIYDKNSNPGVNILYNAIPYKTGQIDLHGFSGSNVLFRFKIGDIDVTSNRESLQDTPRTKAAIKAAVDDYIQYITAELQNDIDKCDDVFSAYSIFESYNFGRHPKPNVIWNNNPLNPSIKVTEYYLNLKAKKFQDYHKQLKHMSLNNFVGHSVYLDCDLTYTGKRKLNQLLREKGVTQASLIIDDEWKKFCKNRPELPSVNAVKIIYPKKGTAKALKTAKPAVTEIEVKKNNGRYDYWKNYAFDVTEQHLYMPIGEYNVRNKIELPNFYYVKKFDIQYIQNHPCWMYVKDYITKELATFTDEQIIAHYHSNSAWANDYEYLADLCPEVKNNLCHGIDSYLTRIIEHGQRLRIVGYYKEKPKDWKDGEEKFRAKYPLLTDSYQLRYIDQKHIREYVQFINEKEAKHAYVS